MLEDSTFILVDENRSEIATADLLPGDWITFTHTGNITEIVHSSTSCSSSSSEVTTANLIRTRTTVGKMIWSVGPTITRTMF